MGTYINIGNTGFQRTRNCEYVDKSGLIAVANKTLFTERGFSCVTRSRRFGKSMAAKMLCAYYDQSCDSRSLFADLKIAQDASFEKHLNKYPVIFLDLSDFVTRFKDERIIKQMDERIK
ncbi:MAG: AAA family ATPase [Prevotella sp.]|nr:AAA family ATPase [Prevotella sp.]